jgi:hypothetical protein
MLLLKRETSFSAFNKALRIHQVATVGLGYSARGVSILRAEPYHLLRRVLAKREYNGPRFRVRRKSW